ncbi:TonB-dependent siderophore receptor [Novosphingobium sp.]|uniref:TonB-dependent receptor n=1 Tax=Novosphingobium sp. TaxID=1874826 RepID=UPI0022BB2B45|nr:TonB-dependent siderophore receptor [Novosphingobium sp.]MCZ8018189.1 TonB-dependent siderophore receptor [Novosphingobium sp.]MCZ8033183.1 TonB-dependent siderophore receptor [Novosphingobium sp.]MCZ8051638.1 TonB-dependent siderophore receptor [Novosphingobium sp.]MCZ8060180.1 TonB-dependent siderophore receptor [Novosphingobium sp.]MCZ8231822.1 TonB-dependent siderophore receptor [Novosphingobium sp.]
MSITAKRLAFLASCAAPALLGSAPASAELAAEAADAPAIIVYGRPDGYDIEKTRTATKTETPLIDVPQTVTVLSREQIDDQGVESLGEALRYVPGVVLGQGEGHRDQVTLRGQNTTADFFLDGLRDDAQYYRPLYNTDRVEVLKGANALIFGRGGGGGVINRVPKAPEFEKARTDFSAGVDSFGGWSIAADLDQPVGESFAARLNATYEALNNHRDRFDGHFTGIAPTLGWKLGEATRLVAAYEYVEDRRITDRGVPSFAGSPLRGFDEVFFGDTTLNRASVTAHIARVKVDHEFSDSLNANLAVQFGDYDKYYGNIYPRAAATLTTVEFEGYENYNKRQNWSAQANLVWQGETGGLNHQLLIGFEASDQDTDDARALTLFGPTNASRITVPLGRQITVPGARYGAISRSSASNVRALSAYIQDQIDLGEVVKLVLGLRYDDFRITSTNRINGFTATRSDAKWSPRAGLIIKPRENVSLYASYARSFLPQSGDQFVVLDATTATLAPEEFRNLEAGVKWDVTERLAFTAALYQLDRTNTRANGPVTGVAVLTGKSRTKGMELALVGTLAKGLQVTLGYALQDGEVTATTTAAPAGRTLAQLPRHQLSAWGRYDVTDRLGIALGAVKQSDQFATISNAVRMPGYTRIDAALFYKVSDAIQLQVNVENLTDTDYFPSAHTDHNISLGAPLNARLGLKIKL